MRTLTRLAAVSAVLALGHGLAAMWRLNAHLSTNPDQDKLVLVVSLIAMTICGGAVALREGR